MKKYQIITPLVITAILLLAFTVQKPKTLFLLGDSIALQYGSYLEGNLKGLYKIERKGSQEKALANLDVPIDANGGDSNMLLEYLRSRETDPKFKPDLLVLNCGLHDIKRNPRTKKINIDSATYRTNLESIYQILQKKNIPMIWVRSTEVIDSLHAAKSKAFDRYAADLEHYNAIADQVFVRHHVPIIDMYSFTKTLGANRFADHVHYVPFVVKAQADFIAAAIRKLKSR